MRENRYAIMHTDKHFIHTTGGRGNGVKCGLFEKIGLGLVVALRNNGVVAKMRFRTIEMKNKLFGSFYRVGLINGVVVRWSFTVLLL